MRFQGSMAGIPGINGGGFWGPRALLGGCLGVLGSLMEQCGDLGLTGVAAQESGGDCLRGSWLFPRQDPQTPDSPTSLIPARSPLGTSTCDSGDGANGDSGPGGAPSFFPGEAWRRGGTDGPGRSLPTAGERRNAATAAAHLRRAAGLPTAPRRHAGD